jgi:hypothetical protein
MKNKLIIIPEDVAKNKDKIARAMIRDPSCGCIQAYLAIPCEQGSMCPNCIVTPLTGELSDKKKAYAKWLGIELKYRIDGVCKAQRSK